MKSILKIIGIVLLVLVSVGGASAAYYWYTQYQKVVSNPQAGSAEEVKTLVKKLSAFMELPAETPSVVTVTDREKLQSQEFFKKAQNGDKIIIYEAARRIILYRPTTSRVVDVAPLVFNAPTQDAQALIQQTVPSPILETNPSPVASTAGTATASGFRNFE